MRSDAPDPSAFAAFAPFYAGRRILIAGALSDSGRRLARVLARCGASLALLARSGAELARLERELRVVSPPEKDAQFVRLPADVASYQSVKSALQHAERELPWDGVLLALSFEAEKRRAEASASPAASASAAPRSSLAARLRRLPVHDLTRRLRHDVAGAAHVLKLALPPLLEQSGRTDANRIAFVGGVAPVPPADPERALYPAIAPAAIAGLQADLERELAAENVGSALRLAWARPGEEEVLLAQIAAGKPWP